MTEVVIVGAGMGKRMGGPTPKVLLPLGPYPVFMHSVLTFAGLPEISALVLVVPAGEEAAFQALCARHGCADRVRAIVAGGARRQDSVAAGCARVDAAASVVLIHDAARPRVSPDVIRRVLAAAQTQGAAIPGVPVADTLKSIDPANQVTGTLDRHWVRAAQTPQGFQKDILRQVLLRAQAPGQDATDEASLAEALGFPVAVVEGDPGNFKLTSPWDYRLAQLMLQEESRP